LWIRGSHLHLVLNEQGKRWIGPAGGVFLANHMNQTDFALHVKGGRKK
jgi:hypothetical protein